MKQHAWLMEGAERRRAQLDLAHSPNALRYPEFLQLMSPDTAAPELRVELVACWTAVANTGGAVGFAFPPVSEREVAPAAGEDAPRGRGQTGHPRPGAPAGRRAPQPLGHDTIGIELEPGPPITVMWSEDARLVTLPGELARVSTATARRAVLEYVTTGKRPTCVEWAPEPDLDEVERPDVVIYSVRDAG
ncbi:Imm1 family immunity protein [Nonomuraea jiangxiensis]|uniref:Immunity protein Imm1 n=1 Tax=Nonomuraea jiangxiensis TaxID=633440 RepID=A0A1G9VHE5_9ACTN|nr:Imm1 family immunity protein [Nonomuraea jiangxiensis]SDM71624.1 Immunity protein Imm1 [Nonomuraea jiangxiensis]